MSTALQILLADQRERLLLEGIEPGSDESCLVQTDVGAMHAAHMAGALTAPATKPAEKKPLWWKVTMHLHSDRTVVCNVTGRRPTVAEIKQHGWHEVHDDGDERFVHPDAIAEIAIESGFATPPGNALAAHLVNRTRRSKA